MVDYRIDIVTDLRRQHCNMFHGALIAQLPINNANNNANNNNNNNNNSNNANNNNNNANNNNANSNNNNAYK